MQKIIKYKNFLWYRFKRPTQKDFQEIAENFHFDDLDIEDCKKVIQRPKLDIYKDYFFMVLRVPVYDQELRCLSATEIDIFFSRNFLITITQKHLKELEKFFEELKKDRLLQEKLFRNRGIFFYQFLEKIYLRNFRILDHIAEDLEEIEKGIFLQGKQREMVQEISIIQRNIINFRRIMRAHDVVLNKIIKIKAQFLDITKYYHKKHQANLLEHLNNSWDILESHKETIKALQDTNESLISWRMNRILLVLTIVAVSALPVSFFNMNLHFIPFYENPLTFWYLVGLTFFLGFIIFSWLKKKNVL